MLSVHRKHLFKLVHHAYQVLALMMNSIRIKHVFSLLLRKPTPSGGRELHVAVALCL